MVISGQLVGRIPHQSRGGDRFVRCTRQRSRKRSMRSRRGTGAEEMASLKKEKKKKKTRGLENYL